MMIIVAGIPPRTSLSHWQAYHSLDSCTLHYPIRELPVMSEMGVSDSNAPRWNQAKEPACDHTDIFDPNEHLTFPRELGSA